MYTPPGTVLCLVRFCPNLAKPGSRPHLCAELHTGLVVCPTCDDWPMRDRDRCKTCGGRTVCTPAAAASAIRHGVRDRSKERNPPANDARWPFWEHADAAPWTRPDPSPRRRSTRAAEFGSRDDLDDDEGLS